MCGSQQTDKRSNSPREILFGPPPTSVFKKALTQTAGVILRVLHRAFRFLSDNLHVSTFVFFLEVGENIWPMHCYPKVLADGKASKRERENRGGGRHPVEVLPPLRQLSLMKRGRRV